MEREILDAFKRGLGGDSAPSSAIEAPLESALESARAAWPSFDVEPVVFAEYLGEKVNHESDPAAALERLPAAEMHLALACSLGIEPALKAFDERYFRGLGPVLARVDTTGATADEVVQILRTKFFVSVDGARPRIAELAGNGDLSALVRVAAVRTALNLRRADKRVQSGDDVIARTFAVDTDPEMAAIKAAHRDQLKAAFEHAMTTLDVRQRTLLRLYALHDLGIDEMAEVYNVHRATAARWLAKVREQLATETRRRLLAELGLSRDEFDSLFRLVESRIDMSFERLLAPSNAGG